MTTVIIKHELSTVFMKPIYLTHNHGYISTNFKSTLWWERNSSIQKEVPSRYMGNKVSDVWFVESTKNILTH